MILGKSYHTNEKFMQVLHTMHTHVERMSVM